LWYSRFITSSVIFSRYKESPIRMEAECDTSIAINYCYFARLQQRAVNSQLSEGSMKPSRVQHNVFTVRHQFALKSLDDQRRSFCVLQYPSIYDQEDIANPDGLVYRENGTRLCRLNETSQFNSSWYSWWGSDLVFRLCRLDRWGTQMIRIRISFRSRETNEEFVARRNQPKQDKISFTSNTDCLQAKL